MSGPDVNRRRLIVGGVAATGLAAIGSSALGAMRAARSHSSSPSTPATTETPRTSPAPASSLTTAPASPITVTVPHTADELTAKLRACEHIRHGTFGVALHDRRNHATYSYAGTWRNQTLSTVKVLILLTALRRCEERSQPLSSEQETDARAMITESDNAAASKLLVWAGLHNVRRIARHLGLTDTVVQGGTTDGAPDWWGYSTSTATDLLTVINGVAWGTPVITASNRAYAKRLMSQIVPEQRWGVCAPPLPTSTTWQTKNGWGEHLGGYRLNSIGHITGHGRNYTAVILSRAPLGEAYGRETVNEVSRIIYAAMARPLA